MTPPVNVQVEKVLKLVSGIFKTVVLPTADNILRPICPQCSANFKNIWANFNDKKGRPMIYPYTYTAKFVQFPIQWYFKHGWIVKYYGLGVLFSIPLFHKISKKSNTPENKLMWKEIREQWYGSHGHHH